MNTARISLVVLALVTSGCSTYTQVLMNSQGQKVICHQEGYGISGSLVARAYHSSCVERAKDKGFFPQGDAQ